MVLLKELSDDCMTEEDESSGMGGTCVVSTAVLHPLSKSPKSVMMMTGGSATDMARQYGEDAGKSMGKTEREILRDPVMAALKSITRQNFGTHSEWSRWWVNSRRRFEVPK